MATAPDPGNGRTKGDDGLRDALSAFNADEVVSDPDELEEPPEQPPAATPDSPNPI